MPASISPALTNGFVAALVTAFATPALTRGATWPVYDLGPGGVRGAVNREIFQGYFDSSANSQFVTDLHEGIDLLASGNGGEEVAAVRTGTIMQNDAGFGGTLLVRVQVGGTPQNPIYETDEYIHLANRPV